MKNWTLLISFLISLTALLFQTTSFSNTGKKRLNLSGYLLLCLLLSSLIFNFYISDVEAKAAKEAYRNQKIKDSLANVISEGNWRNIELRNTQVINSLKVDSSNNASFRELQNKYIIKSDKYNQELVKDITNANENLAVMMHPVGKVTMGIEFQIQLKNNAIDYFETKYNPHYLYDPNGNMPRDSLVIDSPITDDNVSETYNPMREVLDFQIAVNLSSKKSHLSYFFNSVNFLKYYKPYVTDSGNDVPHTILKYDFSDKILFIDMDNIVCEDYYNDVKTFKGICNSKLSLVISPGLDSNLFKVNVKSISINSMHDNGYIVFNKFEKVQSLDPLGSIMLYSDKCKFCGFDYR